MHINYESTAHHVFYQVARSLFTLVGLAGASVWIVESGTGAFFETIDLLANAQSLLSGVMVG